MILVPMILLSMTFLVSCKQKIICEQVKGAQIKPIIMKDISFQFNRCRLRCFDFNKWAELPMNKCEGFAQLTEEKSINLPLEVCDELVGFDLEDIALEVKPKIKKLSTIKSDLCGE